MKRSKAPHRGGASAGTAAGLEATSQIGSPVVLAWAITRPSDVCPIPRRGLLATREKAPRSCGLTSQFR